MNTKPILIGISGGIGSGKTTVADYLCNQYYFTQESFAKPLKQAVSLLFGVELSDLDSQDFKDKSLDINHKSLTYREILQTLGTDWGRHTVDPMLWVNLLEERLKQLKGDIVVSDLRFENEANLIRRLGGIIIHLNSGTRTQSHESESGIQVLNHDIVIDNHHTGLDKLYTKLDKLMERLYVRA